MADHAFRYLRSTYAPYVANVGSDYHYGVPELLSNATVLETPQATEAGTTAG